jgi:hypothetical protein
MALGFEYLAALALTLAIELPIYLIFLVARLGWRPRGALVVGLIANLVTHPNVWFTLYPLLVPRFGTAWYLAVSELFAFWVEALLLYAVGRRNFPALLATSFVANSASFVAGTALFWFAASRPS